MKGNFDVYDEFLREKETMKNKPSGRYNLRSSTTNQTEATSLAATTIYPSSAQRWFERFGDIRKEGIRIFPKYGRSYKLALKKRHVSCLIHKKTLIENAVKKINDEWASTILGSQL